MGDPGKQRSRYSGPSHPWQRERMETESVLKDKYGLKNKREIWRTVSLLKKFKNQTKKIIAGAQGASPESQIKKEEEQLRTKLSGLGVIDKSAPIESILDLSPESIMDRRLQTVVVTKGLARTMNQARQFVVHKHIMVGDQCVNIPSYLVKKEEEKKIVFIESSPLKDEEHPERVVEKKEEKSKAVKKAAKPTSKVDKERIKTEKEAEPTEEPKEEKKEETKEAPKEEPKNEETKE